MSWTVLKFGGTSLEAGLDGVVRAVEKENHGRVAVVVSAIGDTTDRLEQADLDGAPDALLCQRWRGSPLLDRLHALLEQPRSLARKDAVLALGELFSAAAVADWLTAHGLPAQAVDARELVHTDGQHGAALVDQEATGAAIAAASAQWTALPVVTGFIGRGPDGATTTLGRGGSDYTATLLGRALSAACIRIYTDVHGVMTADPRVVPAAHTLRTLSFADAVALAHAGARVLHPHTLDPVRFTSTQVWVQHGARTGPTTRLGEDERSSGTSLACAGGRVTAVGPRRHALVDALRREGVPLRAVHDDGRAASVDVDEPVHAVRLAHRSLFGPGAQAQVFLLGAGGVGTALLEQLADCALPSLQPTLVGVGTRSLLAFSRTGLDPLRWRDHAVQGAWDPATVLDALAALPQPVLVDCTAAAEASSLYEEALSRGISVVTANKLPLAAEQTRRDALVERSRRSGVGLRYETTVGAAVPVIQTLQDLLRAGDTVFHIEGVLSGTLAFLCDKLSQGVSLRSALGEAIERGYTEPRPQDDLGGVDVARKALILARELGLRAELSDVELEPLVPGLAALTDLSPAELLDAVDGRAIEAAARAATEQGRSLRYLARIDSRTGRIQVGPVAVPSSHPAHRLPAGQALVAFTTAHYCDAPLMVQGAGAGCRVTAGGLLTDLVRVAGEGRSRGVVEPELASGLEARM